MSPPSWLETFVELHSIETVDELWAWLITPHGIKSSTDCTEALAVFHRFHAGDADGAVMTALLLCTDHRWRKAAHHLIQQLAESDALGPEDLDLLAVDFVGREVTVATVGRTKVRRKVWPPLRRWAAARVVANDGSAWWPLLQQARTEPSRDGAALAAGVMDAAAAIPSEERTAAVEQGFNWGSGIVRLAALPGLASVVGDEAALKRAQDDPNDIVKRWSPKAAAPAPEPAHGTPGPPASAGEHGAHQQSLFDTT